MKRHKTWKKIFRSDSKKSLHNLSSSSSSSSSTLSSPSALTYDSKSLSLAHFKQLEEEESVNPKKSKQKKDKKDYTDLGISSGLDFSPAHCFECYLCDENIQSLEQAPARIKVYLDVRQKLLVLHLVQFSVDLLMSSLFSWYKHISNVPQLEGYYRVIPFDKIIFFRLEKNKIVVRTRFFPTADLHLTSPDNRLVQQLEMNTPQQFELICMENYLEEPYKRISSLEFMLGINLPRFYSARKDSSSVNDLKTTIREATAFYQSEYHKWFGFMRTVLKLGDGDTDVDDQEVMRRYLTYLVHNKRQIRLKRDESSSRWTRVLQRMVNFFKS